MQSLKSREKEFENKQGEKKKTTLSYKVKKAGSHFLLGVGLRVQAFFYNFQELLMDGKDLLDIGEQHL